MNNINKIKINNIKMLDFDDNEYNYYNQ